MASKVNWNYKNISQYLNYFFLLKNPPKSIRCDYKIAQDVCEYLNSVDTENQHNPDSLISNIFTNKPSGKFISVGMNGGNLNSFFANPKVENAKFGKFINKKQHH